MTDNKLIITDEMRAAALQCAKAAVDGMENTPGYSERDKVLSSQIMRSKGKPPEWLIQVRKVGLLTPTPEAKAFNDSFMELRKATIRGNVNRAVDHDELRKFIQQVAKENSIIIPNVDYYYGTITGTNQPAIQQ